MSFSARNIARTITAVIESGSGVTSVRPFRSSIDLSGALPGISSDTVYSVKPVVHATALYRPALISAIETWAGWMYATSNSCLASPARTSLYAGTRTIFTRRPVALPMTSASGVNLSRISLGVAW